MNIVRKFLKADADGVVHLDLNGVPHSEYEVVAVFELIPRGSRRPVDQTPEERTRILTELAGSWQGEFIRDQPVWKDSEPQ